MAEKVLAPRSVSVRWGAWTGVSVDLCVPANWELVQLTMRDAPGLGSADIDRALDSPSGVPPLETLARSRRRAVIAIDDITRPTRTAPLVSRIVSRLTAAGMKRDAITVLIATGAHRPAAARDVELKIGDLASGLRVISHDPVDGVAETGVSLGGQPVRVNREYLDADLRIGIGAVMPHPFAGYSGGGKIVLPGLADLESVVRSHKYALMGLGGGLELEGNRFRRDMERAVEAIGLDWTVNVVLNSRCETAGLFAGGAVEGHRAAAECARVIGSTEAPSQPLDALILNAYPKDSELLQMEAALVAVRAGMAEWLRPGAPILLLGACPDGLGSHQLFGPAGRLWRKPVAKSYLAGRVLHVISPATRADLSRAVFWEGYPYHESWQECVEAVTGTLPPTPVVGLVCAGPLHVPARDADGGQKTRCMSAAVGADQ